MIAIPVLLTGFEPFDGEAVNPSWEAVRALEGWRCGDAVVHVRCLPCVFGAARAELDRAIDALAPHLVIAVGQAGGRSEITPERVALNLDDARMADNAGGQPLDEPVIAGAPAAYFSTLPIKAITHQLRRAGIPAAVSNTAGTFVCNHLFYGLMHRLATQPGPPRRGGFLHIPYLPVQAARFPGAPSMALATVIEALRLSVATALAVPGDLRETAGQLH